MTPHPYTFRPRAPADNAAIHQVWARSVQATHLFLAPDYFETLSQRVREEYVPNTDLDVAERDGKVVGFMGMSDLHVDSLFIDPDLIRQGLGRLFIMRARRKGQPVTLDVNEQNTGAVAFYKALGFVVTDRSETDPDDQPYPILFMTDTYDPR